MSGPVPPKDWYWIKYRQQQARELRMALILGWIGVGIQALIIGGILGVTIHFIMKLW